MLYHQSALVLGLGKSGKEAAFLLKECGAEVTVLELKDNVLTAKRKQELEQRGIKVLFGLHEEHLLQGKDLLVLSPGVSANLPLVKKAESMNIPVISELEFASRFIPRENIIAITGTNGKTTTTFLTYKILKKSGIKNLIAGNIGIPLSRLVRKSLPHILSSRVVTEVSSFQLEKTTAFSPHIYCILNVSFDHLDRHASFAEYRKIKAIPLARMKPSDFLILNYDQSQVRSLSRFTSAHVIYFSQSQKLQEGISVDHEHAQIVATIKNETVHIPLNNLSLDNFHNIDNVLAAVGISLIAGATPELIRKALTTHRPLAHRQQLVEQIQGVRFIDDSKATNQASVESMLTLLHPPVILIMGGKDKGGDFSFLKKYISEKVKVLILIGEARARIKAELGSVVSTRECAGLPEAVRVGFSLSEPGDSVVLSPGCSSFDQFSSYRHRGRVFENEVKKIKGEIEQSK